MTYKQTFSIFISLLMLSTTGCSGSRMRSLISRSDYMTVEELEAQDALTAEREESARKKALAAADSEVDTEKRTETLVSQNRSVDEKDEKDTGDVDQSPKSERKGLLDIAGLFKRGDKDSEVGPDPFVDVAEPDAVRAAAAERESKEEVRVTAVSEQKTQPFENTIAKLEKDAEDAFDQTAPTIAAAAKTASVPIDKTVETQAQDGDKDTITGGTFADYMAERRKEAKAVVVEDIGSANASIAAAEPAAASEFDQILQSTSPQPAESAFSSELFPELDNITSDPESVFAENKSSTVAVFDDSSTPTTGSNQSEQPYGDPFAEASEKHGFAKLNRRDPWAAFNSVDDLDPLQATPPPDEPADDQFVWENNQQSTDQDVFTPPEFEQVSIAPQQTEISDELSPPFAFQQVSSSEVSNDLQTPETTEGLVIPDGFLETPPTAEPASSGFQALNADSSPGSDPFLDDPFSGSLSEIAADENSFPETATASSATTGFRWSTRTWFLLLGGLLLIGLLILPDRQNRPNP